MRVIWPTCEMEPHGEMLTIVDAVLGPWPGYCHLETMGRMPQTLENGQMELMLPLTHLLC